MPAPVLNASNLKPYLMKCGYTGSRLAPDYRLDGLTLPFAGFSGKPWDTRSACLAVLNVDGDSRAAAQSCLPLGAPTVFVCRRDALDWYKMTPAGPAVLESVPATRIEGFFREHAKDLTPEAIHAAKMRRPGGTGGQLWFVDVGLMPAVERNAGETLRRLVEDAIRDLIASLGKRVRSVRSASDLYKTVFWLLAAKLLHEKDVPDFKQIDLTRVDEVFRRVGRHYADAEDLPPGGDNWRPAIDEVARRVASWGYLGNVSLESLAYLYETALVGIDIRKDLGIHSTPPMLVDHMLAQLWPLIESIEPKDRKIFEPACGQASFLVAAMRWLREFSGLPEGPNRHRYLRDRLHGIEVDSFARELAKLSLALADVPYGNSWRIDETDMFQPGVLRRATKGCTVLLANPPFEPFTPAEKTRYGRLGESVTSITKAIEMLGRTLRHLPAGGVFGIVLPQGVLHDRESRGIREFLVTECELSEISLFADNLFEQADHETAIILGRRKPNSSGKGMLHYRRVRERGMAAFKERLDFSLERCVPQPRLAATANHVLLLPDLEEVWDYLRGLPKLGEISHVQKGFELLGSAQLSGREVVLDKKRPGWIRAVLRADDDYPIWGLPRRQWIDYTSTVLRRPGPEPGHPQVILNYAPVARAPWRLKAVVDEEGLAASSRFVVFRPRQASLPLRLLWALLNSPIANAYAYCFSGKRETLVKKWREFPFPIISLAGEKSVTAAAERYLQAIQPPEQFRLGEADDIAIQQALLRLDAEVLRLYDLPPRLERQLLDLFWGEERKGVGCAFRGYYSPDFKPYLSLHEYLSEDYRRSTAGQVAKHLQPVSSEAAVAALNAIEKAMTGG